MCLFHFIGGAFLHPPEALSQGLNVKASDLIKRSFDGLDPSLLIDQHTHVGGLGAGGTNAFVNPKMRSWIHPFYRAKFKVYLSAAGVNNESHADSQVIDRLRSLIQHTPNHGRHRILAFDKKYRTDGSVNLERTEFYVPNEYVFSLAREYPDLFVPAISVNPYRLDAIDELEKWAAQGARVVKWLPNAMGIDPSDERCDSFYQKMKELDLVLLSHGGEEKAVGANLDQKLGNPLLLRRPLDWGVKVIVAHCASLGFNEDLDSKDKRLVENFNLFMRLMDDKRYERVLFGDISAMTQFNRIGRPLTTVLIREDLHERLLNGSDYPLPAINVLIRTGPLVRLGYITAEERNCLNEIYGYNPLLFDFVLKRTLKLPGTARKLPPSVFMKNTELGV